MKILIVIDALGFGGAERLLISLLPQLRKLGVYSEIVAANPPYSLMPELQDEGIVVHCLNIKHRWAIPQAVYKLTKIYKQGQFDIIWGHLYFGNLYAAYTSFFVKNAKVVWTLHSTGYTLNLPITTWQKFRMWLEKITAHYLVDVKVGVSNAVVDDYQQALKWSVHRIYNGIPIEKLPPKIDIEQYYIIREHYAIAQDAFFIVTPARYVEQKGHVILCEALHILKLEKNWCPVCICTGYGHLKPVIQQRISELDLNNVIRLFNPLKQSELFKLIQTANAVVLPSLREPFGIAAIEAMSLAIPTVLTDTDGFKEVVGNTQSALIVPPNQPRALAEALWQLYCDESLQKKLSQTGAERVANNFAISKIAAEWFDLFNNLIAK